MIVGLALSGLIVSSCAKIGKPPGGAIDETPPVPISSDPANYSTNYNQKKIAITFDEFVKLNNAYSELTVSPPLKETPTPFVRGKKIILDFPATDLDSSTYTIDFGQSIEDNNESNKLPNFQFVVSKMPYIDSFSISGKVIDAFTKLPDEDKLYVQLNSNLSDTAFRTVTPSYIGKTNTEGEFNINHIAPGVYNVFALKDANNNMLYDFATEAIAFSDDLIYMHPDSFPVPDTLDKILLDSNRIDSLGNKIKQDTNLFNSTPKKLDPTSTTDSVKTKKTPELKSSSNTPPNNGNRNQPPGNRGGGPGNSKGNQSSNSSSKNERPDPKALADSSMTDSIDVMVYGYSFNLFSFVEADPFKLYLEEYNRDDPEKLSFFFSEKLDTLPVLNLLYPDTTGTWFVLEENATKDTLVYWLADSNLVAQDSISVEITHPFTDTTGNLSMLTDTLMFLSKVKKDKKSKESGGLLSRIGINGDSEDTIPTPLPVYRLELSHNIDRSEHDLNLPIQIESKSPIVASNEKLIELYRLEDTLEIPMKFSFSKDTSNFKKFNIKMTYESSTSYRIKLHEGAFTDIYGRTIDSTQLSFTTQRDDHYGIIYMEMTNINEPIIVQMLNAQEEVVSTKFIKTSQKLTFDFLQPGKYLFKVIYDENGNGVWDTGNFDKRIQPEHVEFYPQITNVKSNWEVEYIWELKDAITITRPIDEEAQKLDGMGKGKQGGNSKESGEGSPDR